MTRDLFSDYLREHMPDRLSAESVLEWLERPHTDLSWLLVHTPLAFGAADATPNVLLRLFDRGADTEGWEELWPQLLTHPLINAYLDGRWERWVLPGVFQAPERCARPLLEYWAKTPHDARPVQMETSPDPAQPNHLPEWLWSLLKAYPKLPTGVVVDALKLAAEHGWILPGQPMALTAPPVSVPLVFFLATFPGCQGHRLQADGVEFVGRVLGAFAEHPWQLPEISRWLSDPAVDPHYVTWLEQGLRSGVLLGRSLPAG